MNQSPETIWRGRRYWVTVPVVNEHVGWNTAFVPYYVTKETAHRITVQAADGDTLQFARKDWESKEKIYHSKYHEYFYKVKPAADPEKPLSDWVYSAHSGPLSVLGLRVGATKAEIKRAYKRLARNAHPDSGGSHEAFIRLNQAYEQALRFAPAIA